MQKEEVRMQNEDPVRARAAAARSPITGRRVMWSRSAKFFRLSVTGHEYRREPVGFLKQISKLVLTHKTALKKQFHPKSSLIDFLENNANFETNSPWTALGRPPGNLRPRKYRSNCLPGTRHSSPAGRDRYSFMILSANSLVRILRSLTPLILAAFLGTGIWM